jgi:hypothetical protein
MIKLHPLGERAIRTVTGVRIWLISVGKELRQTRDLSVREDGTSSTTLRSLN